MLYLLLTIVYLVLASSTEANNHNRNAADSEAFQSVANEKMDFLVSGVANAMNDTNNIIPLDQLEKLREPMPLTDVYGFSDIDGKLLTDVSTFKRHGQATLTRSGPLLTLQGFFNVNFNGKFNAMLTWHSIPIRSAKVLVKLSGVKNYVRIVQDLSRVASNKPFVQEVAVRSMGQLNVTVSGLDSFEWVAQSIKEFMPNFLEKVVNDWRVNLLEPAVKKSVKQMLLM